MNQSEKRQYLIRCLLDENTNFKNEEIPASSQEQKLLLRGLMNIRSPKEADNAFLKIQDEYLKEETRQKGITDTDTLIPIREGIYIRQGDITTLRCDAIVNAANSGMTGCYVPNHRCIDNCIHTYAGVQLRLECARIMEKQQSPEPTGSCKITKAYNLPCRYVLHTVGPIITGTVKKSDKDLLASCYASCLRAAASYGLESVAFCCISTGEFRFPNEAAAEIAVKAVTEFMESESSVKKVVFNVFKDEDREIYEQLLK